MGTASIHHNDRPDSDSSGDDSPEEKTIIITGSNHHGGQNKGHEGKNTRPFTKRAAHPLAKGMSFSLCFEVGLWLIVGPQV